MPAEQFPSFAELIRAFFMGVKALKGLASIGSFFVGLAAGTAKVISWLNPKKWLAFRAERRALAENLDIVDALTNAPRKSIRDAKPGEIVQLEGRICPDGELLVSPVGKRKCVSYDVRVQQGVAKEASAIEVFRARETIDFFVEDATGRVRVAGNTVTLDIDFDFRKEMAPSHLRSLLEHEFVESPDGWTRVEERTLTPSETISICGLLQSEPDPAAISGNGGYRQERPQRLILKAPPGQFILVTERRIVHEHEE